MSEIRHSLEIEAPADVVFDAVATKGGLAGWWTRDVELVGVVRSVWTFRFRSGSFNSMRVARAERGTVIEWECVDGHLEWFGTSVEFRLTEEEGRTRVNFRHSNWRETTRFMRECDEHWGAYMQSLKSYCETGAGSPDPGPELAPGPG